MSKLIPVILAILLSSTVIADDKHQLMNEKQCADMKDGIGYFLGVADYLFKEIEKLEGMSGSENEKEGTEKRIMGRRSGHVPSFSQLLDCLRGFGANLTIR